MFGAYWRHLIRTRLFGMDIDRSARIAKTALIDRTYPKGVHIEADVVIDEEAVVLTHDMVRGLYQHTRIGRGATLGPRAIILPGITVGCGANIVAGSLVNRDVPDGATVMGNPAQLVETAAIAEAES
ncbi:MAG: acetyltransferase [Erythrobacter sp.]|nr:acetyltransferase [Erythrobacter sp.]